MRFYPTPGPTDQAPRRPDGLPWPRRADVPPVVTRCSLEGYAPVVEERHATIARDAVNDENSARRTMGTRPSPGRRRPAFAVGEGSQPERGSRMKQWLFWALSLAPLLEPLRHLRKAARVLEVLVAVICLQFVIGPHTARRRGAMRAVPFLGAWLPAFLLLLAAVPPEPSARPAQRLPPRRPRRHSRPARILFTPRVAGRAPAARVAPLSVFSAAPADAFPPCATRRFPAPSSPNGAASAAGTGSSTPAPMASRWMGAGTSSSPTPATTASRSSRTPGPSSPRGAASASGTGSSEHPLTWLWMRAGTSTSPTSPTTASRSSRTPGPSLGSGVARAAGTGSSTAPVVSPSMGAGTSSSPTPATIASRR